MRNYHGLSQKLEQYVVTVAAAEREQAAIAEAVLAGDTPAAEAIVLTDGDMRLEEAQFGYLFRAGPDITDLDAMLGNLATLASSMRPDTAAGEPDVDGAAAAGLIFFGQFIDHDITLDVMSELGKFTDPTKIRSLRTPRLELDSVYGSGPEGTPFLYDQSRGGYLVTGGCANPKDLPRNSQCVALIGDPRNDENGLISQLQSLFLRFHNAVLTDVKTGAWDAHRLDEEKLPSGEPDPMRDFEFARRIVRWHYQWTVRHEYLPAIIAADVLADAVDIVTGATSSPAWERFDKGIPIEFSAAAFRFGHSQVRPGYRLQADGPERRLFRDLTSFEPVPKSNNVDWRLFFDGDGGPSADVQRARAIDTKMADELFDLPFIHDEDPAKRSLAFRNLVRGSVTFRLVSGEEAADALGVPRISKPDAVSQTDLDGTPLWYYCLAEAEECGGKLGPVGGQIVGVTLLRMLHKDPSSYVSVDPAWCPFLAGDDDFTLRDLALYVEDAEENGSA